jgi:hypothetical protein
MDGFTNPPMRGRHVYLRPLTAADYPAIDAAQASEAVGVRWRFRGTTPGPERGAQSMWQTVLAQFLVVSTVSDRYIGLVVAYQPNFQDGHAQLAALRLDRRPTPLMILGHTLFVNYVFTCWNFHKLYMAVPGYNLDQIAAGRDRYYRIEGRLHDHYYYSGRRWDELVLAIYRDEWRERAARRLNVELSGPPLPKATRRLMTVTMPARPTERVEH